MSIAIFKNLYKPETNTMLHRANGENTVLVSHHHNHFPNLIPDWGTIKGTISIITSTISTITQKTTLSLVFHYTGQFI